MNACCLLVYLHSHWKRTYAFYALHFIVSDLIRILLLACSGISRPRVCKIVRIACCVLHSKLNRLWVLCARRAQYWFMFDYIFGRHLNQINAICSLSFLCFAVSVCTSILCSLIFVFTQKERLMHIHKHTTNMTHSVVHGNGAADCLCLWRASHRLNSQIEK